MKGITIRYGDSTYDLIRAEAAHEGIGMTAYVREASVARAFLAKGRRGDPIPDGALLQAVRDWIEQEQRQRR